jgi:hypothetical protein
MAYRGNVAETEARKDEVRERVIKLKSGLHLLDDVCVTSASTIIQAVFKLLDVIEEDETMEGLDY